MKLLVTRRQFQFVTFINAKMHLIRFRICRRPQSRKYDRVLRQLSNSELHWLNVADGVTFKLCMTVHKCIHNQAPNYRLRNDLYCVEWGVKLYSLTHSPLSELCTPFAQVAERQHLRSASRRLLVVPTIQLDTYGRRAFAVIGPTVWNALSDTDPTGEGLHCTTGSPSWI